MIIPLNTPVEELKQYQGIIVSGGPQSVYGKDAPKHHPDLFNVGVPILGICYGMQLMTYRLGGNVGEHKVREDGRYPVTRTKESIILNGLPESFECLLTHGDSVLAPPADFEVMAVSSSGITAAIQHEERKLYGVQFHPEVDNGPNGSLLLKKFCYDVCGFVGTFSMESREDTAIKEIQEQVGTSNVVVLVSGGVDSSVCAALLNKALPSEQLYAVHIDSGFMRHHESKNVGEALANVGFNRLTTINATDQFAQATTEINGVETPPLVECTDPQAKRKIIGDTFMKVSEGYLQSLGLTLDNTMLAQGTLRPDLIESASNLVSGTSSVIKTHHNDTQMVRALRARGRIVEPLRDYHKDEVRALGESLGLPSALVWRQPFPGPGLAIRVLCAETYTPFANQDNAQVTLNNLCEASELPVRALILPCRTVGVQGDERSYSSLCGLFWCGTERQKESNWDGLFTLTRNIPMQVKGVNRVAFVWGPYPEEKINVTPTYTSVNVLNTLRQADHIVNTALVANRLTSTLAQMPVIITPVDFGVSGQRSIALRPFLSQDFMTGRPAIPGKDIPLDVLNNMRLDIERDVAGVSRVMLDLTAKPPGTTEWE